MTQNTKYSPEYVADLIKRAKDMLIQKREEKVKKNQKRS